MTSSSAMRRVPDTHSAAKGEAPSILNFPMMPLRYKRSSKISHSARKFRQHAVEKHRSQLARASWFETTDSLGWARRYNSVFRRHGTPSYQMRSVAWMVKARSCCLTLEVTGPQRLRRSRLLPLWVRVGRPVKRAHGMARVLGGQATSLAPR